VGALLLAILFPSLAAAADAKPRVVPDRIDDVAPIAKELDPIPSFANFAWRAFIALNWPGFVSPAQRGEADRAKTLGDAGPRVWETWKSRHEVFQQDEAGYARIPATWNSAGDRNPCDRPGARPTKTLSSFTGFDEFNQAGASLDKPANPLVAQNRTYVRYEVRFNEQEFNSIIDRKWYVRDNLPTAQAPGAFQIGSIEVKAAWRILTERDTPAIRQRYYVVNNVAVSSVGNNSPAAACSFADIALVGLHIVVKTKYRPQWIWMSFEHVDNVPPVGVGKAREPDAKDALVPYAFNDAIKRPARVDPQISAPMLEPISMRNPPQSDPEPIQVVRRRPIEAGIMAMNRAYWALPEIGNTVWANYMLVMAQWPTSAKPASPKNPGHPFPASDVKTNLANTTMETFQQHAPTSCMSCHHQVSNVQGHDFVAFVAVSANKAPRQSADLLRK
jgi:hypothetical protein